MSGSIASTPGSLKCTCGVSGRRGNKCQWLGWWRTTRAASERVRTQSRSVRSMASGSALPGGQDVAGWLRGSGWAASSTTFLSCQPRRARKAMACSRTAGSCSASNAGLPVMAMRSAGQPARTRLSRTASASTQTRSGWRVRAAKASPGRPNRSSMARVGMPCSAAASTAACSLRGALVASTNAGRSWATTRRKKSRG
ncbi:hypothetical protein GALL_230910 [mine drainage metagenome]|uniref:Uncharacterized protein n=1 Tax=mine drainage metagenome TaxID=410659 RepID=A0A1J5RZQ7_9ZZZZ